MPRGKALKTLQLIAVCAEILQEIQPATVRAVCYRLFTMGFIPSMVKKETARVSAQLVATREAGDIPWEWIVDQGRQSHRLAQWNNPAAYADVVQRSYRRDRWIEQPRLVEVWSEKATVQGILQPVVDAYGVEFRPFSGFNSTTRVHDVAEETADLSNAPRLALYVGDWDPSGLCMSEVDLPKRIRRYGGNIELRRIALNTEDVDSGNLPPFSAESKRKDPRYRWFRETYGSQCWELDALSPVILRQRVEQAITDEIDPETWNRAARVETAERESLITILDAWKEAKAS